MEKEEAFHGEGMKYGYSFSDTGLHQLAAFSDFFDQFPFQLHFSISTSAHTGPVDKNMEE